MVFDIAKHCQPIHVQSEKFFSSMSSGIQTTVKPLQAAIFYSSRKRQHTEPCQVTSTETGIMHKPRRPCRYNDFAEWTCCGL